MIRTALSTSFVCLAAIPCALSQETARPASPAPWVRRHDDVMRATAPRVHPPGPHARAQATPLATDATLAWHGQPVPGGGTLDPVAFANSTTFAGADRVVFFSQVNGASRNQGLFAADAIGLDPIVRGCGGGGGSGNHGACGDPSPIGGTFAGFFGGTFFVPAANAQGDVLFLADVIGGSAPRGLFLRRGATGTFVKIAAVGDSSPAGGTLGFVGHGSINASGDVVFLAAGSSIDDHQILLWSNGALAKVARVGDPAPGGGTYQFLGGESLGFVDGTQIPVGPLPDVNDDGAIAFRAIPSGGFARGIVVRTGTTSAWYARAGDAAPGGGTYFDFAAPSINAAGEVAFFADYKPTPTTFSSAWFVGARGAWRRAIGFFDPIAGGEVWGLAFSRNPMQPLNDAGNLLVWISVKLPSNVEVEHLVLARENGAPLVVARKGDPVSSGGIIGSMDAWPSIDGPRAALNAATPSAPGGSFSAHMVVY